MLKKSFLPACTQALLKMLKRIAPSLHSKTEDKGKADIPGLSFKVTEYPEGYIDFREEFHLENETGKPNNQFNKEQTEQPDKNKSI